MDPTAKLLAETATLMAPTLSTYKAMHDVGKQFGLPAANLQKIIIVYESGLESLEKAHAAGVTMGLGTDLIGEAQVGHNEEPVIRASVQLAAWWSGSEDPNDTITLQPFDEMHSVRVGCFEGASMPEFKQRVQGVTAPVASGGKDSATTVQRKLRVGAVSDPAEREADKMADAVVTALRSNNARAPYRMDAPGGGRVQRAQHNDTLVEPQPGIAIGQRIQRREASSTAGGDVSADVEHRIQRLRPAGSPLADPLRRSMEGAFGADFGAVRVHDGAASRDLNNELGAQAFTTGNDIFFRDGVPDGRSREGQALLAHELTHTVQQGASVSRQIQRKASKTARLVGATLNTTERSEPTIKGHSMAFDLTLDIPGKAGTEKVKEVDSEVASSLYGVTMEWWEEIVVDYDFDEADPAQVAAKKSGRIGNSTKPWSDIYLSNPQSQTFFRWKGSVKSAQSGGLSGTHTTGVNDNPAVNLSADSYKRRTLRFRISVTDSEGKSFKFDAIQVLVADNGALTSSVDQDSNGASLVAGTGEKAAMRYSSTVPLNVRHSDAVNFATQLRGKMRGVKHYLDTELDQAEEQARTLSKGNASIYNMQRVMIHKDLQQGNRLNGAPLIPSSDKYLAFDASDGGLLVAQVSGKKAKRMFYTKNQPRQISVNVNGNKVPMSVREFEQIPADTFNPGR